MPGALIWSISIFGKLEGKADLQVSVYIPCKRDLEKDTTERIEAIHKVGFTKSEHLLIVKTGYAYDGYWTVG